MHNPDERAYGRMCRVHFEQHVSTWREVDACADCQLANWAEDDRIQRECTIDPSQPYGRHIALTCRRHPELRWSTKNIDRIGARSIFFVESSGTECSCHPGDLIVAN